MDRTPFSTVFLRLRTKERTFLDRTRTKPTGRRKSQTRPAWDCHRTAAPLGPPGTTPGLIGSPMAVPSRSRLGLRLPQSEPSFDHLRMGTEAGRSKVTRTDARITDRRVPNTGNTTDLAFVEKPRELRKTGVKPTRVTASSKDLAAWMCPPALQDGSEKHEETRL